MPTAVTSCPEMLEHLIKHCIQAIRLECLSEPKDCNSELVCMLEALAQYGPLVGSPHYPLTILGPREERAKKIIKQRLRMGKEIVFYHYPAASLLMVARNCLKHRPVPLLAATDLDDPHLRHMTEQHFHGVANNFNYLSQKIKRVFYHHMTSSERLLLLKLIVALRSLCFNASCDTWDIERLNRLCDSFAAVLFRHGNNFSSNSCHIAQHEQPNLTATYLVKFLIIHLETTVC